MESKSYFYENERLVFLTVEDARKFFFEEELYGDVSTHFTLNDFLNEAEYNYECIFYLSDVEKEDILSEYHETLFEFWAREELLECDVYE